MRTPLAVVGLGLVVSLSDCAARSGPRAPAATPSQIEEPVTALMQAALDADARGERADSLWTSDATIIADGELRDEPPRFAGVGTGGAIAITESRLDLRQGVAWVYLEYRWSEMQAGTIREARATVVLTSGGDDRWRIVHAHSSSVRSGADR